MTRKKKFLSENQNKDFTADISELVKDLYYISETDSEIITYSGAATNAVTGAAILQQTGKSADTPVEERDFTEFFQRLTAMQDWFGKDEKKNAKCFEKLEKFMQQNLCELKVFKIGSVQIDLYVVGLDSEGKLVGIQTKAVET